MKTLFSILKYFIASELFVFLVTGLCVYSIFWATSSTESFFGGTFYAIGALLTGVNIILMMSIYQEWKNFFTHVFRSGYYLRIFFSMFVPGITITQSELDEANNIKKKSKN